MTDEKIKEDKYLLSAEHIVDDCSPEEGEEYLILRTAEYLRKQFPENKKERLAKIDVLEEIHKDIEGNMSYGIESRNYKRDVLNIVYKKIQSLKAGQ